MYYLNKLNELTNLNQYNGNKFLAGIALLMLNIGSKYLIFDISKSTEQLLKLTIIRRFTLFCIFFIGTRNVIISLVLTATFIVFSSGLFNEKSKYCILPKNIKEEEVNQKEYEKAIDVIERFNKQNDNQVKNDNDKKEKKLLYINLKKGINKFN